MPYEFVEAEMFLEYRGVKIYHCIQIIMMVDDGQQHKYLVWPFIQVT